VEKASSHHFMTQVSVCVLIPAYNEEKEIGCVIEAVQQRGFAVVAVDDGSTDKTALAIQNSGAQCVISAVNEGKGAALRKGLQWVIQSPYQAVIVMDADGQHLPDDLDLFMQALESSGVDLVIGNRMHDPKGMPFIRRCTNRVMSGVISLITRQSVPDTQCGYRALTRRVFENIELRTHRFEIESEMILSACHKGLRIQSIPISSVYQNETSHIRPFLDTFRFFRFIFQSIFFHRRSRMLTRT
jgi:glycosyltransferase involved in cell wall biosynthesis